jgi:hypothetical protein
MFLYPPMNPVIKEVFVPAGPSAEREKIDLYQASFILDHLQELFLLYPCTLYSELFDRFRFVQDLHFELDQPRPGLNWLPVKTLLPLQVHIFYWLRFSTVPNVDFGKLFPDQALDRMPYFKRYIKFLSVFPAVIFSRVQQLVMLAPHTHGTTFVLQLHNFFGFNAVLDWILRVWKVNYPESEPFDFCLQIVWLGGYIPSHLFLCLEEHLVCEFGVVLHFPLYHDHGVRLLHRWLLHTKKLPLMQYLQINEQVTPYKIEEEDGLTECLQEREKFDLYHQISKIVLRDHIHYTIKIVGVVYDSPSEEEDSEDEHDSDW